MKTLVETRWGKPERQRVILIVAAAAMVVSGLFPPWMFTFHKSGSGFQSERSAGYALIFWPPNPGFIADHDQVFDLGPVSKGGPFDASCGVRLDTVRLMVEWICILVAGGAAWVCARPNRTADAASQPPSDIVQPF